ncbi:MAG: hypothetical protein WAZ98_10045 [Cyclobacteriaceae bacterium]
MKAIHNLSMVIFALVGCIAKPMSQFDILEAKLLEINSNILDSKSIIVIPREGCGGCIQNATFFVKNRFDSIESTVIFTGVGDRKLLHLQLGDKVLANNKCFVDTGNILMESQLTSIYPIIIFLENNKIRSIETYTPIL